MRNRNQHSAPETPMAPAPLLASTTWLVRIGWNSDRPLLTTDKEKLTIGNSLGIRSSRFGKKQPLKVWARRNCGRPELEQ
jgi:hypothetical protein